MELSQKYVYNVWKHNSFSKAAKSLYVSQPSLSATVSKLEMELGFQIFDRSTHPITTTARGRIYLNYLQEIHMAEAQLKHQLEATEKADQGHINIGGSASFIQFIFPALCRIFSEKHPNVSLTLDTKASEEKLKSQLIDLHFTLSPSEKNYTVIPAQHERLIVVIRKDHPAAKPLLEYSLSFEELSSGSIPPQKEISDPSVLSNLPFIKSGTRSNSDQRLSAILGNHLTAQFTVVNATTFDPRYRMAEQGLGAIFASDFFLKQFPENRDTLCYFALSSPISYRTNYLQYKKSSSPQKLLDEFIATVIEYCNTDLLKQR